jgi:DNA-binding CsgD family transcriptional regulator
LVARTRRGHGSRIGSWPARPPPARKSEALALFEGAPKLIEPASVPIRGPAGLRPAAGRASPGYRLDAHERLELRAARDRAREALATGQKARERRPETRDELTAQETQIARLARDGLSNPEIATRLFISPRTMQSHLRKIFIKLGISSRARLVRVLPRDRVAPDAGQPQSPSGPAPSVTQ